MDYTAIAEKQDSYYPRQIPLKEIPELTYDIWRDSIDHEKLHESCKGITKDSDCETLADWYLEMKLCSNIWLDEGSQKKRWKWVIVYDIDNSIEWKLEKWVDDSIVMEYYTNYILND